MVVVKVLVVVFVTVVDLLGLVEGRLLAGDLLGELRCMSVCAWQKIK